MSDLILEPWFEQYRPQNLNELVHQKEVVKALENVLHLSDMPHLLFYGPPGTGKTSMALAVARGLFGPNLIKSRLLELNASDERGINVVRNKIKLFASYAVAAVTNDYPYPSFKLIILDEADNITPDAQAALRRTIESYSKLTRFCFIANFVSRIIEPLVSRCAKFRFSPLNEESMANRILYICMKEGVQLQDGVIKTLRNVSNGDLRKAITTLQSAVCFYGSIVSNKVINEIAGMIPDEKIDLIWSACQSGRFEKVHKIVKCIIADGYPAKQILLEILNRIIEEPIQDAERAKIAWHLAATDKALTDGSDEYISLLNLSETILRIITNKSCEDD